MRRYYNLEITKTVPITGLKTVERLILDKNFYYPVETHNFYEFVYVLAGNVFCEEGDKTIKLNAGNFKLIPLNRRHRYFTDTKTEIFIICFKCNSGVLPALDTPIFLEHEEKALLNKLIDETERSFEFPFKERVILKKNAPIGSRQLTEILIEELLIILLRRQKENVLLVKNQTELQKNLVEDIVNILSDNVYNNISLDYICKKLYYSNTYLNSIFKKYKKTTIMRYYTLLKIEEGKNLLKKGFSATDISDKLCFDNSNYFCKVFKKNTGLTPTKFKNETF